MPPRHRPIAAVEEWIALLTEWTGGPPILIMHFHPAIEDATWDAERPVAPVPGGFHEIRVWGVEIS